MRGVDEFEGLAINRSLESYWTLLDALRAQRRILGWKAADDRPLLERIDEVFETLDDDAQGLARAGSWRGWPDRFEARMERMLVEDIDPDDVNTAARPPRCMAA